MKKMVFEKPEIEVIHFDGQDTIIATSGCPTYNNIPIGPPIGCQSAADAMIIG